MLKGHTTHSSVKQYAISATLLCSVSSVLLFSVAHAATIGKTTVTSNQNESLAASIEVSDINAANFSADLANPVVYEQMGLKPTTSMAVSFKSTSATAGVVHISTSQPVSMPFADVVLAINDSGKRNTIPKTLLMPLSNNVTALNNKNSNTNLQTLIVRREAPPKLFVNDSMQAASITPIQPTIMPLQNAISQVATSNVQILAVKREAPPLLFTDAMQASYTKPIQFNNGVKTNSLNTSNMQVLAIRREAPPSLFTDVMQASDNNSVKTSYSAETADIQVLTVRHEAPPLLFDFNDTSAQSSLIAKNNVSKSISSSILLPSVAAQVSNDTLSVSESNAEQITVYNNSTPFISNIAFNTSNAQVSSQIKLKYTDLSFIANESQLLVDNDSQILTSVIADDVENLTTNYTVQLNDNLWLISKQIALQNNSDVSSVMAKIQHQNPEAFIAQDSNRLKADAQLNLTDFEIVPSQQDLQSAIYDYRQSYV